MTAHDLFKELCQLLQEQEKIINRLLSCGKELTVCLRNNEVSGIPEIVQQQSTLSRRLAELEKQRLQVQQKLEREMDLPGESTLQELASFAGDKLQAQLKTIRCSLRQKTQQLQEINSLNQTLSKQGLQFTNTMLNLLRPPASNAGYSRDGRRSGRHKHHTMFNKTV